MAVTSIEEAIRNLPALIEAARGGEDIVITDGGRPVARLVAEAEGTPVNRFDAAFGKWAEGSVVPSWEEWTLMDGEIEAAAIRLHHDR
jgi:prevent-host-death family protein